ncbi:MAG: hypothetical protein QOK28_2104 [Actinomycetota bacterium]|jgi:uncharacterized membrane protein
MYRYLRQFVLVIAVLTLVGLVALWPRGGIPKLNDEGGSLPYVKATVVGAITKACADPEEDLPAKCREYRVHLRDRRSATFLVSNIDFSVPPIHNGDHLLLSYNRLAPAEFRYSFVEFDRSTPLLGLALVFVAVVVGFGRWKGVRAIAGLAVSALVVMFFLLPALLNGRNTTAAALVATSVVAFAALYIAHGVTRSTTVALVGTLASVLLIAAIATVFTALAHMTGLSDESFQLLRVTARALDPRGVLIAGMVLGALGVLDDVTVTQVSAVAELREANPAMSRRDTYRAATRIGRDHVASTVNTLVLAYAGASLALLLFFFQEGRAVGQILNREVVAVEIARALVGSIGLIVAVPITTALAVSVADQ